MALDFGQTFLIDPNGVKGADSVLITSIDLFFAAKPAVGLGDSGISSPGVSVKLCAATSEQPDLKRASSMVAF